MILASDRIDNLGGCFMDKPLYLTFDDGPQPGSTDVILSILAEYGALANWRRVPVTSTTTGRKAQQASTRFAYN